ncbi:MAG: HAD-IB family hydrolase [Alphaproteobacteria bacterium]|nr:HAD-IB family hydrolase [Alphaproteobacteria bacterium]
MKDKTKKTIAIFDCDHTIVKGDSFVPFLAFACGWPRTTGALTDTLLACLFTRPANARDFIKQRLLDRLLKGRKLAALDAALVKIRSWRRLRPAMVDKMYEHKAAGHHIVVASGALTLYMPALLDELPYDAVIATDLLIERGTVSSTMTAGNCVREGKAARVRAYMEQNGPFAESYGYGNAPHDLPMLELVKHKTVV